MSACAIYARFSSDRQSRTSAEDQERICRERAAREGWDVAGVYADLAISGANHRRPRLTALLSDVATGRFDIVLVESLDRVARDQENIARIFKRLSFAGVRLVTLADGEVNELHIGLKGTMDALELRKIADKTRRGAAGALARGHIPGGLSYGYAVTPRIDDDGRVELGLRTIREDQAAVVRRIFAEYVRGRSPRAIAHGLNAEGIPSPRGGEWRGSVIIGSGRSLSGILANTIYVGRYVWNKRRWVRDPESRNRLSRMNVEGDRLELQVPALRIIDDETWAQAQAVRARGSNEHVVHRRRPNHFLSRIVKCGVCGGNYTYQDRQRWGCSRHKEAGTCANAHRIAGGELEERVLAGLKEKLLSPEAVSLFVGEYHRARQREDREAAAARAEAERRLVAADAAIGRLVAAISDGGAAFPQLKAALTAKQAERERAAAEVAEHAAMPVIALHPTIAAAYRRRIAELAASLSKGEVTAENSAGQIRSLIDRIVIHPAEQGTARIEVFGSLASALGITGNYGGGAKSYRERMVAGTGFEPVTFRL